MTRLALVLVPLLATACMATAPTSTVTAANLTGTWSWGQDVPEPASGPNVACLPGNPLTLTQSGTAVTGRADVCGGPCAQGSPLTGTNEGGVVVLKSDQDDLKLTYNPQTQHLVGTRNGKAFWAVPYVKSSAPACGGIVQ